MMRHATLGSVLAILLLSISPAPEPPPFTVFNPKHLVYPEKFANQLYYAACHNVAAELRPDRPSAIPQSPVILLNLAAEHSQFSLRIHERRLEFELAMPRWEHIPGQVTEDDRFAAMSFTAACLFSAVPFDHWGRLAHTSVTTASEITDVRELLEEQR